MWGGFTSHSQCLIIARNETNTRGISPWDLFIRAFISDGPTTRRLPSHSKNRDKICGNENSNDNFSVKKGSVRYVSDHFTRRSNG
jgi:hypothetical protein